MWGCIWGLRCWACVPFSQRSVYPERGQTGCRRHRALSKTRWTRWYGANKSEKNTAPCTYPPWKHTVSAGQSPEREKERGGEESEKYVRHTVSNGVTVHNKTNAFRLVTARYRMYQKDWVTEMTIQCVYGIIIWLTITRDEPWVFKWPEYLHWANIHNDGIFQHNALLSTTQQYCWVLIQWV